MKYLVQATHGDRCRPVLGMPGQADRAFLTMDTGFLLGGERNVLELLLMVMQLCSSAKHFQRVDFKSMHIISFSFVFLFFLPSFLSEKAALPSPIRSERSKAHRFRRHCQNNRCLLTSKLWMDGLETEPRNSTIQLGICACARFCWERHQGYHSD